MTLGKNLSHVPKSVPKKSPVFSCSGLFQIDHFDKIHGFDDVCLMRYFSLLVNFYLYFSNDFSLWFSNISFDFW